MSPDHEVDAPGCDAGQAAVAGRRGFKACKTDPRGKRRAGPRHGRDAGSGTVPAGLTSGPRQAPRVLGAVRAARLPVPLVAEHAGCF